MLDDRVQERSGLAPGSSSAFLRSRKSRTAIASCACRQKSTGRRMTSTGRQCAAASRSMASTAKLAFSPSSARLRHPAEASSGCGRERLPASSRTRSAKLLLTEKSCLHHRPEAPRPRRWPDARMRSASSSACRRSRNSSTSIMLALNTSTARRSCDFVTTPESRHHGRPYCPVPVGGWRLLCAPAASDGATRWQLPGHRQANATEGDAENPSHAPGRGRR